MAFQLTPTSDATSAPVYVPMVPYYAANAIPQHIHQQQGHHACANCSSPAQTPHSATGPHHHQKVALLLPGDSYANSDNDIQQAKRWALILLAMTICILSIAGFALFAPLSVEDAELIASPISYAIGLSLGIWQLLASISFGKNLVIAAWVSSVCSMAQIASTVICMLNPYVNGPIILVLTVVHITWTIIAFCSAKSPCGS